MFPPSLSCPQVEATAFRSDQNLLAASCCDRLTSLVRTLTNLGLIDEYQLLVHPVVLGSGKPLFQDIKSKVNLKLVNTRTHPSGVVLLSYQPREKCDFAQ